MGQTLEFPANPENQERRGDIFGVFDGHRMGAVRFKESEGGPFLNDDKKMASPPWTSLRELEQAARIVENDDVDDEEYAKWLDLLIAPGSSLGGARPKASVIDSGNQLWIAKFPSKNDQIDVGAWEFVVQKLGGLQQLYYVSFDYGNADYQGYQILAAPRVEPQKTSSFRESSPGFKIMNQTYQHQRWTNSEYYLLVFPLAVKLNISYLYPIDDLSTWGGYEKHYDRLQVPDTTDVSKTRNRQMVKDFLGKVRSLPKDSSNWIFANAPETIRELLHVESYVVDEDIKSADIRMLAILLDFA